MADDKLIVGLSADIRELQSKLNEAQNVLKGYASNTEKIGKNASNGFNNITNSVKGLVGAYIGLQAAQMAVSKAFNTALQLDSIEAAYNQIFKSSEIATLQLERLKGKADELGLSFLDLATSYKTFAAASYTTGLSLKETNEIFDAVTNAAAQMKLNSEQTQGTLLALSQMISKGTVSMEELRQQLGERLPGAMKIFADGLGVSVEELNKMIASGKVMANDALPKFAARLNEVYKTTEPINGLQAAVNRLSNAFTTAVQGGAIGKFFEAIVNGATKAIGLVENAYKGFQILINKSSFQGNQIFDSGAGEINKLFETGGDKAVTQLAELIEEYNKLGKAFGFATEEGKAYFELIKIAGAAQAELLKKPIKQLATPIGRVVGGEDMELMVGTSEQMQTAKDLYDLYEKFPQILSSLGAEYSSNPFFRDLINQNLSKSVKDLKGNIEDLQTTSNMLFTDPAMEAYIANIQNIVTMVGTALTQSFESALTSGQDFFKVLGQAIKGLIAKLMAAVAAAAALSILLNIFTAGGAAAVGGFSGILKGLSGFDFSGGAGGASQRIASPTGAGSLNQGSVEFSIMGDKLYGVLQNYESRLSRLQ